MKNLGLLRVLTMFAAVSAAVSYGQLTAPQVNQVFTVDGVTPGYTTVYATLLTALGAVQAGTITNFTIDATGAPQLPVPSSCSPTNPSTCPTYLGVYDSNTGATSTPTKAGIVGSTLLLGKGTYYGRIVLENGFAVIGASGSINGTVVQTIDATNAAMDVAHCQGCQATHVQVFGIHFLSVGGNVSQIGYDGDCTGSFMIPSSPTQGQGTASSLNNGLQYSFFRDVAFTGFEGPGFVVACDSNGGAFNGIDTFDDVHVFRSDPIAGTPTVSSGIYSYDSSTNTITISGINSFVTGQSITVSAASSDPLFLLNGQTYTLTGVTGSSFQFVETTVTSPSGSTTATFTGTGTPTATQCLLTSGSPSNTLTLTMANSFQAGQSVQISAPVGDPLININNQVFQVLPTGLSITQIEINVPNTISVCPGSGAQTTVATVPAYPEPILYIAGASGDLIFRNNNYDVAPGMGGDGLYTGIGTNVYLGAYGGVPGQGGPTGSTDQNPYSIRFTGGQIQYGGTPIQFNGGQHYQLEGVHFEGKLNMTNGLLFTLGGSQTSAVDIDGVSFTNNIANQTGGCLFTTANAGTGLSLNITNSTWSFPHQVLCGPSPSLTPQSVRFSHNFAKNTPLSSGGVPYLAPTNFTIQITSPGAGGTATATVNGSGGISGCSASGGSGYTSPITYTSFPYGSGGAVTITESGGVLTGCTVNTAGTGYGYAITTQANNVVDVCSAAPIVQINSGLMPQQKLTVVSGCSTSPLQFGTTGNLILNNLSAGPLLQGQNAVWSYDDNLAATNTNQLSLYAVNVGGTFPSVGPIISSDCNGPATPNETALSFAGLGATRGTSNCTGFATAGLGFQFTQTSTVSLLSVRCAQSGYNSSSGVFTVYKQLAGNSGDSSTSLTVTYGTTPANQQVQDTTDTVTFNKGDIMRVRFTTQPTESLGTCSVSVQLN